MKPLSASVTHKHLYSKLNVSICLCEMYGIHRYPTIMIDIMYYRVYSSLVSKTTKFQPCQLPKMNQQQFSHETIQW